MPHLILIKHSQPALDPAQPAQFWALSAEGRRRCAPLARRLALYRPDVLISSIEPKAISTAELLAGHLARSTAAAPGLHEHDRTNVPFHDSVEAFQAEVRRFFEHPADLVFGGETADAAHTRFGDAVHAALDAHPRQTVAIVAHGTVITLFVTRLHGLDPYLFWLSLGLPSFVALARPDLALVEIGAEIE